MEKSHVSMEQKVCVVCGKQYDSGSILLDKRLRKSMERHTLTGWGMCEEHQKLKDDGFVAIIGCDPAATITINNKTHPGEAHRTGRVCHLKVKAFKEIFDVPVPDQMVAFCEDEVITTLQSMVQQSGGANA